MRSKTTLIGFAKSTLWDTLMVISLILRYSESTLMTPRVPPGRKTRKLVTAIDNAKIGITS